jgi:hypothetical protein
MDAIGTYVMNEVITDNFISTPDVVWKDEVMFSHKVRLLDITSAQQIVSSIEGGYDFSFKDNNRIIVISFSNISILSSASSSSSEDWA